MPLLNKKKIAIVVATPMTARAFLLHQISELAQIYDVTLIANLNSQPGIRDWLPEKVATVHVPIVRAPNLFYDLKAFLQLIFYLNRNRFSLVHSVTPKAGLVAMLASWLTRVPVRLHTFTGQVWATKRGIRRTALRMVDKLIGILATKIIVDSHSQRDFLLKHGVIAATRSTVLGHGSISGVDTDRFKKNPTARRKVRQELQVSDSATVVLFLGRLNKEKGVIELSEAFNAIRSKNRNAALWFVGPDEDQLKPVLEEVENTYFVPFTTAPEAYMAAADIFCLPSYREGFGSVVIEAGACGLPAIGSNIYGLSDAIVDGTTGLLVAAKSASELSSALQVLIDDADKRKKFGQAARERAVTNFSQQHLTDLVVATYNSMIQK